MKAAAAEVAAQSSWVHLDDDGLAAFAARVPVDAVAHPERDAALTPARADDDEARAAFPLVMAAVNFGSGWFPVVRKRPGLSGARSLMACVAERFDRDGPFTAEELLEMNALKCTALFEQDPGGPAADLMALYAQSLNDLGTLLTLRHRGSYAALVDDAAGDPGRLVELLAGGMALFRDVWTYRGRDVPLFKRAQLAAADLALAGFPFDGLDRLTMFPDNLVPHVLRVEGVLRYEPDLLARIGREELLTPGSEEEVEIRAVAVHAVECLAARLPVTPMQLDMWLWNRGQLPQFKAQPRHRCRTTAY